MNNLCILKIGYNDYLLPLEDATSILTKMAKAKYINVSYEDKITELSNDFEVSIRRVSSDILKTWERENVLK